MTIIVKTKFYVSKNCITKRVMILATVLNARGKLQDNVKSYIYRLKIDLSPELSKES